MYKSYTRFLDKNGAGQSSFKSAVRYVYSHIIKLLSEYWFIYIIFVPMGLFFGRSFLTYYGINPIYYLCDFLGVSYLFFEYNTTMNVTWWFMSIIIILYLFFSLIYKIYKYSPEILLALSVLLAFCPFVPELRQFKIWLCPFVFGMYVSDNNLLERLSNKGNNRSRIVIFSVVSLALLIYLRYYYFDNGVNIDFLLSFFIVMVSYLLLSKIPILNSILEELGTYSGQIFMFHTFIYLYYFKKYIYFFKYPIIIYIVMLTVCYIIARLLSWLMKITRYNKLIKKLTTLRG